MNIANKLLDYLCHKAPEYKRKVLELGAANGALIDIRQSRDVTQAQLDAARSVNVELAERTREISRKLCNVSVQRPPNAYRRKLRVVVEIDSCVLERGFLHGDDALVLEYISRDIGHQAFQEIRRANFHRWEM